MDKNCGIYIIRAPSGSVYVGSSIRLNRRKIRHFYDMKNGTHHCEALNRAWVKHQGRLDFHIVEICSSEVLRDREQWWIDYILSSDVKLYNGRHNAETTGSPLSERTKAKIAAAQRGRKHTEEAKAKMRKPKSPEHAAAISKGKKGSNNIIWTDQEREKRRVALKAQWERGERDFTINHVRRSWADPVKKAKRIDRIRASWTPDRIAKHRERMIRQHAARDPAREALERVNWIAWG